MSIITKETPLKVWHLIVFLIVAAIIYFAYDLNKRVRINTANIQVIGNFLNQNNQPQAKLPAQKTPAQQEIK